MKQIPGVAHIQFFECILNTIFCVAQGKEAELHKLRMHFAASQRSDHWKRYSPKTCLDLT